MSYADEQSQDNETRRIAIYIGAGLLLAAGGLWWWMQRSSGPTAEPVAVTTPAVSEAVPAAPPEIKHPLEPAPEAALANETAPPAPVDPDALAGSTIGEVFEGRLAEWVIPDQLLRRLVATLDNLPRDARTEQRRPLRAPSTPFAVKRETLDAVTGTEHITLAPANFARYDNVMSLLARTDPATIVAGYRRLYPQLQKSYEDLGYPGSYLNDRVVEVIDHLLETPEPAGPILLEQPKVLYRFADADLESRSAGQKLLLRMGVDHARVVKEKLRAIRALIAVRE